MYLEIKIPHSFKSAIEVTMAQFKRVYVLKAKILIMGKIYKVLVLTESYGGLTN
jgi:hypothetical protein